MTERERIGQRIAEIRVLRGISREELASRADLSKNNIDKIEGGRYDVRLDTLAKIADALSCQLDFISKKNE